MWRADTSLTKQKPGKGEGEERDTFLGVKKVAHSVS